MQETLSIIKPDAFEKKVVGKIISLLEKNGFNILEGKIINMNKTIAEGFYKEHKEKDFFGDLIKYMTSGPCLVLKISGKEAISRYRKLMGETNPAQAADGTIRKLYASSIQANSVHGSDSPESAKRELNYFFD